MALMRRSKHKCPARRWGHSQGLLNGFSGESTSVAKNESQWLESIPSAPKLNCGSVVNISDFLFFPRLKTATKRHHFRTAGTVTGTFTEHLKDIQEDAYHDVSIPANLAGSDISTQEEPILKPLKSCTDMLNKSFYFIGLIGIAFRTCPVLYSKHVSSQIFINNVLLTVLDESAPA